MSKRLTLNLPREFLDLCDEDETDPETVLKGFIADLCEMHTWKFPDPSAGRVNSSDPSYCTNGSDERLFARQYYERVGYPYRARWGRENRSQP